MPRRKEPLWLVWKKDDNHISKQIHREFEQYAKDTGFYPTQNALYSLMTKGVWVNPETYQEPRYPKLTVDSFGYWFDRLISEGYIALDSRTRAINSTGLIIVEKESRPPELE